MDEDLTAERGVPWRTPLPFDSLDNLIVLSLRDRGVPKPPRSVRDGGIIQTKRKEILTLRVLDAHPKRTLGSGAISLPPLGRHRGEPEPDPKISDLKVTGVEQQSPLSLEHHDPSIRKRRCRWVIPGNNRGNSPNRNYCRNQSFQMLRFQSANRSQIASNPRWFWTKASATCGSKSPSTFIRSSPSNRILRAVSWSKPGL